jgi:hypothetical protein
MTPLNVNLRHLIEQVEADLAGQDVLARVTEAQQRARTLTGIGDQLIDHFVAKAREAGTSWSQLGDALGVTKQAAQQRWLPNAPNFSRFTDRARHVLVLAQERARELRHGQVDTEHLLLGVIAEEEGFGGRVVIATAGSREAAERAVTETLAQGTEKPPTHIPFTNLNKAVLQATLEEALRMGHNYIGTEHILLGLLKVPDGRAAQILDQIGLTYQDAYAELTRMLEEFKAARKAAEQAAAEQAAADQPAEPPADAG